MNDTPLISVILPVYNAEKYIVDAINSILNQTFRNFEFIILNDGSKDNSESIIQSFTDERIRYFKHDNCGLAATLNKGIEYSKGKYIARQDQDDISYPERFAKQIEFLEKNPKICLVGTRARIFTDDLKTYGYHNHPSESSVIMFDLMFNNPFVHSSVIFRKNIIDEVGLYNTTKGMYEDYNLWSRMMFNAGLANLAEVLVDYRHHDQGMSKASIFSTKNALYGQCVLNIETLLKRSALLIQDLPALIHGEFDRYKGSDLKDLIHCLSEMEQVIVERFPNQKELIKERKTYYLNILKSAHLSYRLKLNEKNVLKFYIIKIKNKIENLFR
ncbi:MAG: glycosyltransferase [Sphingobacteriaceae bacterium]|nr:glycosyltransferase [Sphingobacteriaceae bacterium]